MAFAITPNIVRLRTRIAISPTPSQLQQSGAIISVGGTTLEEGAYQFCSTRQNLLDLLSTSGNYQELPKMAKTFFTQGNLVGFYVLELGAGTPDSEIATLDAWKTANPSVFYAYLTPAAWGTANSDTVSGITVTNKGSGYLDPPLVTISAPPDGGTTATGVAVLNANGGVEEIQVINYGSGYVAAPTITIEPPVSGEAATATSALSTALYSLINSSSGPTGLEYYFITTTESSLATYTGLKAGFSTTNSPTELSDAFPAAMPFYQFLSNQPGLTNRLAPMQYRYAFGVTPWPLSNSTNTSINNILTAYGNLILTGAEGGISQAALFRGTLLDGTQASWWYGVDWFQIQVRRALAAAIINGSNTNPPLLYDDTGIKTLLGVAQGVADRAVAFGCALSAVVTAVPFYEYTEANPEDYAAGTYNGLSAQLVGQNGFLSITFDLTAYQFVIPVSVAGVASARANNLKALPASQQ